MVAKSIISCNVMAYLLKLADRVQRLIGNHKALHSTPIIVAN